MFIGTSSDAEPNGSDLAIVTVVLQYGVFPTLMYTRIHMGIQQTLHDVFIHEGPFVTNNTRDDHDVPKSASPDFRQILSTTP